MPSKRSFEKAEAEIPSMEPEIEKVETNRK